MGVTGTLPWARAAFLFPAEIAGGLVAAALNSAVSFSFLQKTCYPGPSPKE